MQTIRIADLLDAFSRFTSYLLKKWKQALLFMVLGGGLAIVYSFLQSPKYEGRVTFILEEKSSGGGGLAGLASQFGIDLGGLSGGSGMFTGDNILDILTSRSIVEKVLLTKVDSAAGANAPTMADLYLQISGWKTRLEKKGIPAASLSYHTLTPETPHTMQQDSILFAMYEKLVKKNILAERLNKKGSIIKVITISNDPVFSKVMSERLLEETRKLYVEVKTGVSAANMTRLEQRADSLLRVINAKSYQSASMQLLDANAAYKTAAVPAEATQRDRMVTYTIYTEVMKNLEAARMAVANQTPVIQLLDISKYPLRDQRKSTLLLGVAGLVIGFLLFTGWAFMSFPSGSKDPA